MPRDGRLRDFRSGGGRIGLPAELTSASRRVEHGNAQARATLPRDALCLMHRAPETESSQGSVLSRTDAGRPCYRDYLARPTRRSSRRLSRSGSSPPEMEASSHAIEIARWLTSASLPSVDCLGHGSGKSRSIRAIDTGGSQSRRSARHPDRRAGRFGSPREPVAVTALATARSRSGSTPMNPCGSSSRAAR